MNYENVNMSQAKHMKVMGWSVMVSTLFAYHKIAQFVQRLRAMKKRDIKRWNAALAVQRTWRRYFYIHNRAVPSPRSKFRRGVYSFRSRDYSAQMALASARGRLVCAKRAASCTIIIHFLRDLKNGPLKTKFYLRTLIRKLNVIQHCFKSHRAVNNARVALLGRYVDRAAEALHLHISIVLADRGLDLDNLHSYDTNRIAAVSSGSRNYSKFPSSVAASGSANSSSQPPFVSRLIQQMNSAEFHSLLRDRLPSRALAQLQRFYVGVFGTTGSRDSSTSPGSAGLLSSSSSGGGRYVFASLDRETRRAALADLLFRTRRNHQAALRRRVQQLRALHIPRFGMESAREFISTGQDPLSRFLAGAFREQEERHQALLQRRGDPCGVRSREGLPGGRLLLLGQVGVEEVLQVLLQLSEAALRQGHQLQQHVIQPQPGEEAQRRGLGSPDGGRPLLPALSSAGSGDRKALPPYSPQPPGPQVALRKKSAVARMAAGGPLLQKGRRGQDRGPEKEEGRSPRPPPLSQSKASFRGRSQRLT